MNLLVLFNHTLTAAQESDARAGLGASAVIEPPEEIKNTWSTVPPETDSLTGYLAPVREWLLKTAKRGDFILVQGEFGATFRIVCFCLDKGLIPVYSTTRREAMEEALSGGSVAVRHVFSHVRFRRYGK